MGCFVIKSIRTVTSHKSEPFALHWNSHCYSICYVVFFRCQNLLQRYKETFTYRYHLPIILLIHNYVHFKASLRQAVSFNLVYFYFFFKIFVEMFLKRMCD